MLPVKHFAGCHSEWRARSLHACRHAGAATGQVMLPALSMQALVHATMAWRQNHMPVCMNSILGIAGVCVPAIH